MTQRHAAQRRHHELVVVDADIGLLEARRHLELARRDFIVTRDDRHTELVQLVLHLGDAGLDALRDAAEVVILELLATSLRFAGFEVVTAANGRDALAKAESENPDLAVLDVMLPDMDGFTVTRKLRASGQHFPILFLTAKDETEDKVTGLTVGGDDYVTKPFSLDEVVARISAVLRRTQPAEEDEQYER